MASDVFFPPSGGEGQILIADENPVSAISSRDWVEVSVSELAVNLTVAPYGGLESRYSTITVFSADDSVRVTIEQMGLILDMEDNISYILSDEAVTKEIPVSSNSGDFIFTTQSDWLSAEWTGKSILLNISENNSGHIRHGAIEYSVGNITDSISVSQGEIKDILGNYLFCSSSSAAMNAEVTQANDSTVKITLPESGFSFAGIFHSRTLTLNIPNRQYLGTYADGGVQRYAFLCIMDSGESFASVNVSLSMDVNLEYDAVSGKTRWMFTDNGSWDGYVADGWTVIGFSSMKGGEPGGTRKYLDNYINPYMMSE